MILKSIELTKITNKEPEVKVSDIFQAVKLMQSLSSEYDTVAELIRYAC